MFLRSNLLHLFFQRSAVWALAAAGLFFASAQSFAQERAGGERHSRFMDRIDAEEGARRLAEFRLQRLEGDYCFRFELEHKPRKARTVRYQGIMWGAWSESGPVTRFRVMPRQETFIADDVLVEAVELIIQNGVEPEAWIRYAESEDFRLLEGEALFEPILPGLLYSPFDLQMPFVYWDEFVYEGPTLIGASRVAQQFLMLPPEGSASAARGVSGVRIGLDDTYGALWRIEVLGAGSEVRSRFAVESFQKVQEQYIVKRITLTDYPTKDRTTFDVEAASVGLFLKRDFFNPEAKLSSGAFMPDRMEKL